MKNHWIKQAESFTSFDAKCEEIRQGCHSIIEEIYRDGKEWLDDWYRKHLQEKYGS